ncbi:MAG: hypothetical protein QOE63_318 [Acidimicrobiaceae bacterium]|jgi:uncharacterized membrane protein YhhN
MTGGAWVAFGVAAVLAVGDWLAVERANKRLEYVCKPLTMVALIAAALALDPTDPTRRGWFVAALVLSLAGDVFLMLPQDLFVAGLASFLLGHVAYIAGFIVGGLDLPNAVVGLLAVVIIGSFVAPKVIGGVRRKEPELLGPVVAYMTVISVMVVCARGSGTVLAAAGALAFYGSDALIAWNRFVRQQRHGRLAIIVTYHAAQALLVASLATR